MNMNESPIEDNVQGQYIAGPSNQIHFPSNPNYGRPSKSALPMEIQVDNFDHAIVKDENKARR